MITPGNEEADVAWHALSAEEVLERLHSSPAGLSSAEAAERLGQYGTNEIVTQEKAHPVQLVLKQLRSPLIYMLLAAALLSAVNRHPVDALVILAVVILNTIVGVLQEWRAEQALEALKQLSAPLARVLRDDEREEVPAAEIVPGDVLVLEEGDRVAADARMISSADLHVDESALTGESQPVSKDPDAVPANTVLAEQVDMVRMSTPVTGGHGTAVVVATGMRTTIGEIAREVRGTERSDTPLQRYIARLGTTLGIAAIVLSAFIFLLGILRGITVVSMLLYAVAAAVSAIPEGLPAVISVVLAIGMQRMAKRGAIIRRLPAVETLGSTTVICSDKTGTITRNAMTVTRMWTGGRAYTVTGEGFEPSGEILRDGEALAPPRIAQESYLQLLLILGCLANNAELEKTPAGWRIIGDPTEGALLVAARKAGLHAEELRRTHPRSAEITFSSKRQYMATLQQDAAGARTLYVKGAPERVLAFCAYVWEGGQRHPLTDERRGELLAVTEDFARQGLRVLAGALRDVPPRSEFAPELAEHGLTFLGFWGMYDPPRAETAEFIREAQDAGIHIKMITGDHALTASVIARQVGIIEHGEETVSGEALEAMPDEELTRRIEHLAVFARVTPAQKLRLIRALHEKGQVVAMTGDGVNDAPALKQADIGIAMGITGTEVAKEAADMVLTDDNFATIVKAVVEGRVVFSNLRRVVFFLVTTNLGEILTLTLALLLGLPLPLTAVMILWVNLVTDGVCTVPLGMEPAHGNVLQQPPRPAREGILDPPTLRRIFLLAPLMALGTLLLFWYELNYGTVAHAQTIAFCTMVAFQWFHALNARSSTTPLARLGLTTNRWLFLGILASIVLQMLVVYVPPLQRAFRTVPLSAVDWLISLAVSSSILFVSEIWKWWSNRRVVTTETGILPD